MRMMLIFLAKLRTSVPLSIFPLSFCCFHLSTPPSSAMHLISVCWGSRSVPGEILWVCPCSRHGELLLTWVQSDVEAVWGSCGTGHPDLCPELQTQSEWESGVRSTNEWQVKRQDKRNYPASTSFHTCTDPCLPSHFLWNLLLALVYLLHKSSNNPYSLNSYWQMFRTWTWYISKWFISC